MTPRIALALAGTVTLGCHGKFKKAAVQIDAVRVEAQVSGGPLVSLGRVATPQTDSEAVEAVAAAIVNTAQLTKEVRQTRRLAQAVDPLTLAEEVQGVVVASLDGSPFGVTQDAHHDDLLRLQILSYGVDSGAVGAPASFLVTARAIVTMNHTERVYRKTVQCTVPVGDPDPVGVALGLVNNTRVLNQMGDQQIEDALRIAARACGEQLVEKMKRHAV